MGDNFNVKGYSRGTVVFQIKEHDIPTVCIPKNMMFVEILKYNLHSASVMAGVGLKCFSRTICLVSFKIKNAFHKEAFAACFTLERTDFFGRLKEKHR